MTDLMNKAALRCHKCGKFKSHAEFRPPIEDPARAICDQCAKYVPGTGGLGPAAKKQAINDARTLAATALVKMVRVATDRQQQLAKQRKQLSAEARVADLADRIVKALAERTLLKARAKREKAERRITKAKQEIRDNQQRRDELTARVTRATDQLAVQIEDLSRRITVVKSNLDAGQRAIELQRVRNWAADRDRAERDADEWVWKAHSTDDPDLRAAYFARADGVLDDDDE